MNDGTRALIATAAYVAGLSAICGAFYAGYVVALPSIRDIVPQPQLEAARNPTLIEAQRAEREVSAQRVDREQDAFAEAQPHEIPKPPPYAAWAKAKAKTEAGSPNEHNGRQQQNAQREKEWEQIAERTSAARWSYDPGRVD